MDNLESLNPPQRQAVTTTVGPVLILAGPGSGKTRVITHRVAFLMQECQTPPWRIMAVTFTNKAANEMRQRLETLLPGSTQRLTIGTFHAICSRLLRREAAAIGLDPHFVIYDTDDQIRLVKQALKELDLDEKRYTPRAMLSQISSAKSDGKSAAVFGEFANGYWDEVVTRVYQSYQKLLQANHAFDFDDLLLETVHLLQAKPDILERYQERYLHIMVDEFQDTNTVQYLLVRMLSGKHRNLCVVGDEDQSVYGWRGARPSNVQDFRRDFPDATEIYLEQNYRSTKAIVGAALKVISGNQARTAKKLWTANDGGAPISLVEKETEEEEASFVIEEVQRLIASGAARPKDCAVMYRTNAQSRALEQACVVQRIPYNLVGTKFYQRKEVKDIVAYLRILTNSHDTVSLYRIINTPARSIGEKTVGDVARWAAAIGKAPYEALQVLRDETPQAEKPPFGQRATQSLVAFVDLIEELKFQSRRLSVPELIGVAAASTGYLASLGAGDGDKSFDQQAAENQERRENIAQLAEAAVPFAEMEAPLGLQSFLEETALFSDTDEYREDKDAVTLITLHAAKGLEFPVVFLVGMEEGVCPHSRSFDAPEQMEEERRLCYVGMTRAIRRLYMTHATTRSFYGTTSYAVPSRFLFELPKELTDGWAPPQKRASTAAEPQVIRGRAPTAWTPGNRQPATKPSLPATGDSPATNAPARRPVLKPGERVRHAKFGEGVVLEVNGAEDVTVLFPGAAGAKRLSLTYAPLEKI
jgi:DNA helicase II / ATP-dependent DNA helicase PcrA